MGIIRNEHGTYYARKKVPKELEEATARVLGSAALRVSWLKRTLGTKDLREANILAKPILAGFDRTLASARALLADAPLRESLTRQEIERIANYHYASMLGTDEQMRREGDGSEEVFGNVAAQLAGLGVMAGGPFRPTGQTFGMSEREWVKKEETLDTVLPACEQSLARGNLTIIEEDMSELMALFRIRLRPDSETYRELGMAVLKEHVRALRAMKQRNHGEPVDTPVVHEPDTETSGGGDTVSAALAGWQKAGGHSPSAEREFPYAVARFVELHGDIRLTSLNRGHVRAFREALQQMPKRRSGDLLRAPLPALVEWSKRHPGAARVSRTTVNKLLGGVQAVANWGAQNGLVSDDAQWADPFSRMRLEVEQSDREPWEVDELQVLFNSAIYSQHLRPAGGKGEAAYWLPLLALFTGARLNEIASLRVSDISQDRATGIWAINIDDAPEIGRRLKTAASRRVVPVHPELTKIGFLKLVASRAAEDGQSAMLFPLLKRSKRGGFADDWTKWFGRHIREIGVKDTRRVFHSLRHGFKDALRAQGVSEDINDALMGQTGGGVGRKYGRKAMVARFGLQNLADTTAKASYPGLDLTHLYRSKRTAGGSDVR